MNCKEWCGYIHDDGISNPTRLVGMREPEDKDTAVDRLVDSRCSAGLWGPGPDPRKGGCNGPSPRGNCNISARTCADEHPAGGPDSDPETHRRAQGDAGQYSDSRTNSNSGPGGTRSPSGTGPLSVALRTI